MAVAATDAVERHGTGPDDGGSVDLSALEFDPYPTYRELRKQGVVWVDATARWLVTRWDDIDLIERDATRFSARETDSLQTRVMGRTMLRSDGSEHRRLRRALQDPLSPQTVQQRWLPMFSDLAHQLIEGFSGRGTAELMSEFCGPLAARCLSVVLGFTDVSDADLQFWSQALMDGCANYGDDPRVWERTNRARAGIAAATAAALKRVRETPDASLISAMAHASGDGQTLTEPEILSNVMLVIGGGLNEPRDGLGAAIWALLTHPDQLAQVRADASLWPQVTEEALRWMSPLAMFPREVAAPVRFGDTKLLPGARLGLIVASANRDQSHWDRPDDFDVNRPKSRTVAFGVGHHFCLGVWMSRHEIGGAGLPALLARLPGLRLDLDRPPALRGWVFRGHTRLHVRWDAAGNRD